MTEPIDPRLLSALRRDRQAPVADEVRTRVAARLRVFGSSDARPPRPTAAPMALQGLRAFGAFATTFAVGAAMGALLHALLAPQPQVRIVYVDRPPTVPVQSPPPIPQPDVPSTATAPSASSLPSIVTLRPDGGTALDRERALLDQARVALVAGETDDALATLDRYSKAYRHPRLGEEHDALQIQALVHARRYDEARARADAFRRASPRSLLRPAVDAAIDSIP